ncbi:unnamed protein product [Caenorhabditis angaria]|uniref:Uncharacterized protein n=1 Tax=Caenorhabditis angaria TaxID=860376 RepID=A0A9P1IM70_9PELO|nr:unnamed protein product [Caenorhabditis angaria]
MNREERYRKIVESRQIDVSGYVYNIPLTIAAIYERDDEDEDDEDEDPMDKEIDLQIRKRRMSGAVSSSTISNETPKSRRPARICKESSPPNISTPTSSNDSSTSGRAWKFEISPPIEAKSSRSRCQKSAEMFEIRQEKGENDEEEEVILVKKKPVRRRVIISSDEEEEIEKKSIEYITLGDSSDEEEEDRILEPVKKRERKPRVATTSEKIDKKRARKPNFMETDPAINPAEIYLDMVHKLPDKPRKKREVKIREIFATPPEQTDLSIYLGPEDEQFQYLPHFDEEVIEQNLHDFEVNDFITGETDELHPEDIVEIQIELPNQITPPLDLDETSEGVLRFAEIQEQVNKNHSYDIETNADKFDDLVEFVNSPTNETSLCNIPI